MKYSELMATLTGEDGMVDAHLIRNQLNALPESLNLPVKAAYAELLVELTEIERLPEHGFLVVDGQAQIRLNTSYWQGGSALTQAKILGLWIRFQKLPEKVQTAELSNLRSDDELQQVSLGHCSEEDLEYAAAFAHELVVPHLFIMHNMRSIKPLNNYIICETADITVGDLREVLGAYECL